MIYKKISGEEYDNLQDISGAYLVLDSDGTKYWYFDDLCHREDGPAIERTNGTKFWWIHGKRHRIDGPAAEWAGGSKEWWIHGERHCEDGPAVEWADGYKEWWIHGKEYETEEEWQIAIEQLRIKEIKDQIV